MGDCPTLSLSAPVLQQDSPLCPATGSAGRMGTVTGYLMVLGVALCVPMVCCAHGAVFWARNPAPGHFYLYTVGGWQGG